MVRRVVIILLSFSLLIGCARSPDQKYMEVVNTFFAQWFALNPAKATLAGVHDYDDQLSDISPPGIQQAKKLYRTTLDNLDDLNPSRLSPQNEIDYHVFSETVDQLLFNIDSFGELTWNPILYIQTLGEATWSLSTQHSSTDSARALDLTARLRLIPDWLQQAKQNLTNGSEVYLTSAIQRANATADRLNEGALSESFSGLPSDQANALTTAEKTAAGALRDFASWLQNSLLPNASKDFRLGKDLYDQKLRTTLKTSWSTEEILDRAQRSVDQLQDEMLVEANKLSIQWWNLQYRHPSKRQKLNLIQRVLDRISAEHPKADNINSYLTNQIQAAQTFVELHNLITLDSNQSLTLISMPPFVGSYDFSRLRTPGPLSKNSTYFLEIKSIPEDWSTTQTESFLREYNNYALQLIAIHEAIPGKFVQRYYSDRFPSLVRTLFPSVTTMNGWSAYVEKMMVDEGWDAESPQIRLMQLKRELDAAIDAMLDQKIQTQGLTRDAALRTMTVEGFQEQTAAQLHWNYLVLHPVIASTAFVGKEQILALRDAFEQANERDYSLLEFHKRFLSYGAPPIKYLRQILLEGAY